jgi:alpha-beta hydrolase superfamily lysophospholipase
VDAIRTAPKLEPNEPTIVMTHSMGGNILYDVLTYFAPELAIDVWISVASQVGLFEEMKIFKMSDPAVRAPNKVQTLKPPLKFWLNIYDPADILAFKTAPVFSAADRDLAYRTGDSTFSAHGAYFKRPSFYHLIYEELRKVPL